MNKIALIDGDSIAYRAACSVEKTKYLVLGDIPHFKDSWKEARELADQLKHPVWSRREIGTLDEAKTILDSFMRRILENASVDYDLFLSPSSGNYREAIAQHTRYKGNRDNSPRPVYLADLRNYMRNKYGAEVVEGHEAEDEVSIQAGKIGQDGYIVVGHDKDLLQIPGRHYDWVGMEHFEISSVEARKALWVQVLMGDTADNIPGCWGIGFQKAKNRIDKWIPEQEELIFDIIVEEYEKSRKTKDCPYRDESDDEIYARVFETYWLVKLKETEDEASWFQKNNKMGTPVNGKTKASGGGGTSNCAPSATGREPSSTISASGKLANGATASER